MTVRSDSRGPLDLRRIQREKQPSHGKVTE
jgi:hypothetical protein